MTDQLIEVEDIAYRSWKSEKKVKNKCKKVRFFFLSMDADVPHCVCFVMQTFSPDETAFIERGKDTGKHILPISHVLKLITTCRAPVGLAGQGQREVEGSG